MMSTTLAIGDILEVKCSTGVAYLSYAGKHATMGDAVWLISKIYESRTNDWHSLFAQPGFFLFYPAHTAVRHRKARKVGYSTDAIRFLPSKRRTATATDEAGAVITWLITEGSIRTPRRDEELTDEERELPVTTIWNHEFLVESLAIGRRPT